MSKKRLWHIVFMILFLVFFLYEANRLNQSFSSNKEYDADYNQTMAWLRENSSKSSIILTDWQYGPNVATLANRGVVTTTKVYPSEIKFTAERYKDASKFFFAVSESDAMEIVKKYNITHVLIPKNNFQYVTCKYINICDLNNTSQYFAPDGKLLPEIRNSLIVTRMMYGKRFYNFRKVYDSNFFVIYQVAKPNNIQNDGLQQYKGLIKGAFDNSSETERYSNVYGVILPHHLTYTYQIIADLFKSVKGEFDTIIILGPDHFSISKYNMSTSTLEWETSFGNLTPNGRIIKKLGLKSDEAAHTYEHSVRVMFPFIKYKFPNSKIIPIILNKTLQEQEAIDLGREISKLNDTLLIASIDFSHDSDLDRALEKDYRAIKTIQDFKKNEIYSLDIDSKPALLTLLTAMEYKNTKKIVLLNYTNSGQLTKDYPKNVGYVSMIFQK
ncbi:MAG: AmmeMemoRadiSam system protein B [Nanoarchaeota archaeon]|nr:AmmeMemoRadiSam system protein B [Nanoarchaeota archaeon]